MILEFIQDADERAIRKFLNEVQSAETMPAEISPTGPSVPIQVQDAFSNVRSAVQRQLFLNVLDDEISQRDPLAKVQQSELILLLEMAARLLSPSATKTIVRRLRAAVRSSPQKLIEFLEPAMSSLMTLSQQDPALVKLFEDILECDDLGDLHVAAYFCAMFGNPTEMHHYTNKYFEVLCEEKNMSFIGMIDFLACNELLDSFFDDFYRHLKQTISQQIVEKISKSDEIDFASIKRDDGETEWAIKANTSAGTLIVRTGFRTRRRVAAATPVVAATALQGSPRSSLSSSRVSAMIDQRVITRMENHGRTMSNWKGRVLVDNKTASAGTRVEA